MHTTDPVKCGRKTRGGYPCKLWPLPGQRVCRMHGGKSPQALAKAEERMRALIHPAISSLARQIDADEFSAVRYVLDWAGYKAAERIEGDQQITIQVLREEQPITLEHTYRAISSSNGHTND